MQKYLITILNPGEAPEHNGQTIHALELAAGLKEGGATVTLLFAGKGVTWLPRFLERNQDSHPFVKHYASVFDSVKDLAKACNMCCIRFNATEKIAGSDVPIIGEGQAHIDVAQYALDGYQIINY